ncbi:MULTISPECIES: hypothetical protein [unclassified Pseudoalteromonas]|uniref:hypothetical protein n=1 Tax=unclassified Pseudoalteromonas TaxID=194690 RepID=UPI002097BD65|nr:hypothetical protein [Pseudoalteromonas sp. XMcav2-N]MCO7189555.1 hypothetical protein [Pseudoalteromonas sp. XMcav2-N]
MSNAPALGSKDNPGYVKITNTPELQHAYSTVAHPHSKGFIYNGTMKPSIADKYKSEGYTFCMRNLNQSDGSSQYIPLTAQETNRITGTNDQHGYELALMPVYILDSSALTNKTTSGNTAPTPSAVAADVLSALSTAAIPIGTTVWLQLTKADKGVTSDQIQAIEHQIFQSGYSVGILGDEVQQQQQTNARVLESTYTPFEQSGSGAKVRTITIGDNTGSFPIYWAVQ